MLTGILVTGPAQLAMNDRTIEVELISEAAFAPFGTLLDTEMCESFLINRDKCRRFHKLATVAVKGDGAHAIINLFRAQAYTLPLQLDLVEQHPLGSQAFLPQKDEPFLVIVAADEAGKPGPPRAFATKPGQGVQYHAGTWHGVLTPILSQSDFIVVDRDGPGNNLVEHNYKKPFEIIDSKDLFTKPF